MGARPGPARAAERESPGSAPVAATVSAPGVPDCGRARDAGAHRLGRLAAAPARPVRGGRARHGSGSGDARLDRPGVRDRHAQRGNGARGGDDRPARAGAVRLAPEPHRAPARRAGRLAAAADRPGRAPAVERGRPAVFGAGAVQRAGERGPARRHRRRVSHLERPARPGSDTVGRVARPPGCGARRALGCGHLARRPLAGGAPARCPGRRRACRGRSRGLRTLLPAAHAAARFEPTDACSRLGAALGCAAVRPGTIVVAVGGNAVAPPGERPTIANQFRHTRESLAPIVDLAREGWAIALVHGNGPQVGDELARNELAADQVEPLPLGVLVAATAGWMGYMIQQSLQNALARVGVERQVVTLVTQTLCDANDPNLRIPTKPIGHSLDATRVARLLARAVPVREEQPGRWRRLAPSPKPIAVVERDMIHHLVAAGHIVVACGGGGPPVYNDPVLRFEGIDAVADKDRVAAILGREIGADVLLILTNVDAVYHGFGTKHQRAIRHLDLPSADHLLAGKELGTGSMRPKVEAAADFVRAGGGRAIIAELAHGLPALRGEAGTTITLEHA
ncbi:MAG: hypothetical protein DMD55_06380 [Gemmatimonadetes bacterium]|nr:MAG: hypothetical protein DMD55_06380 [Gemmatimonadota bacterium]